MKRATCLALALLAFTLPAAADTTFYTETWAGGIGSNWTVQAGSPLTSNGLLKDLGSATRLDYSGTPPSQNHSIQSTIVCEWGVEPLATEYHFLRDGGYKVEFEHLDGSYALTIRVWRADNALLGSTGVACGGGTVKSTIIGSAITVKVNGNTVLSLSDSLYATGKPGVGTLNCRNANSFGLGQTILATPDTTPPSVPTNLAAVPYVTKVNLSWTASTDNDTGVAGYKIYRGGAYQGSSATTAYTDNTVSPSTPYSYTVSAYDGNGNESAQSSPVNVTTLPPSAAPDTGGPKDYTSTWGAGPEKISMLTGALTIRLPLPRLQHRSRGPGLQMIAAWNSGFWYWDAAGTRMNAIDTGYGLGFYFMAGAIYPVYSGTTLVRYDFLDGAGVIHRLEWVDGTIFKTQDSTYFSWNRVTQKLSFRDGTVWTFNCYSRDPEPDGHLLSNRAERSKREPDHPHL